MFKSRTLRILNKGLITSLVVTALSFFIPLVPCKTAPVVVNPTYAWGMCKLPNFLSEKLVGINTNYWGLFTRAIDGLVLQFLIVFILFTLAFLFIRKKAVKILDLTKK